VEIAEAISKLTRKGFMRYIRKVAVEINILVPGHDKERAIYIAFIRDV